MYLLSLSVWDLCEEGVGRMRFENRLNKDKLKFKHQNPVWDNGIGDALNVFEMINLLNKYEIDRIRMERYRLKLLRLEETIGKELSYLEDKAMDNPVNRGRIRALKELKELL